MLETIVFITLGAMLIAQHTMIRHLDAENEKLLAQRVVKK